MLEWSGKLVPQGLLVKGCVVKREELLRSQVP